MQVFVEFDFRFGRMDVDVESRGINGQEQHVKWVLTGRQQPFVGVHDGPMNEPVLDKPLVDEQKLLTPRAAGEGRLPDKPLHPYHICALFDGHQALIVLAPEHANDALAQGGRPQIKQLAVVVGERKMNGLVRQCDAVKFIDDVPHFNGVGF